MTVREIFIVTLVRHQTACDCLVCRKGGRLDAALTYLAEEVGRLEVRYYEHDKEWVRKSDVLKMMRGNDE